MTIQISQWHVSFASLYVMTNSLTSSIYIEQHVGIGFVLSLSFSSTCPKSVCHYLWTSRLDWWQFFSFVVNVPAGQFVQFFQCSQHSQLHGSSMVDFGCGGRGLGQFLVFVPYISALRSLTHLDSNIYIRSWLFSSHAHLAFLENDL